jgi:hypothetical protein
MDTLLNGADGKATVGQDQDHSISLALLFSLPVGIAQARGRSARVTDTTSTTPPSQAAD